MSQFHLQSQEGIQEEPPDSLKLSPEGELNEPWKISAENKGLNKKLSHSEESEKSKSNRGNAILITEKEEMETDVDVSSIVEKAAESLTEATAATLGLGKGHQQQSEDGENKSILSKLNESIKSIEDNVLEAIASVEDYFSAIPGKAESGKSRGQSASDEVDGAFLKLGESCAHIEPKSVENPFSDVQSQGLLRKTRQKVSEVVGSLVESSQAEPIAEVDELASDQQYPNFTEEVISGASELGSMVSAKACGLIQGLKRVLTFDKSSTDNTRDSVTEGEYKEKEEKRIQQTAEAAVKENPSYKEKEGNESIIVERNPNHGICSCSSKTCTPGQHTRNEAETKDLESVTSESKYSISGGFCKGNENVGIMPPSKTDDNVILFKRSSPNPSGDKDNVGQVSGAVSSFLVRKQGLKIISNYLFNNPVVYS